MTATTIEQPTMLQLLYENMFENNATPCIE